MKEVLMEEGLPLALVCAAVAGLTVALFGLPKAAPPAPAPAHQPREASARRMDEALTRAIAALQAARAKADQTIPLAQPALPGAAAASTPASTKPVSVPRGGAAVAAAASPAMGVPAPPEPAATASLLSAANSLADAVKAIRAARTEEDFVNAEIRMRGVREQMQSACTSGANSAFCDSAREIGSLGF